MGLRSYFGIGQAEQRTLACENVPSPLLQWSPAGSVTPANALQGADVYAAVRALSDAASSLPLHVYRKTQDGRQRLDNRTAELLANPAPAVTTAPMIATAMANLQIHGNCFFAKYRRAGEIEQLGLISPDRVQVAIENGQPVYTLTHERGHQTRHSTDDLIHVRGMSSDGLLGLSPIRQCRTALGLADSLAKHGASVVENSAVPRGILKLQRFGDADAQVAALRQGWEGNRLAGDPNEFGTQRGAGNAGRIAVVSGEVDYTAVELPLGDLEFIAQRKLSTVEIARIFRVPAWAIDADSGESMTYSNVEGRALDFARYSLRPWLVLIEQRLSADADLCPGPTYVEFEMDGILRADSSTRSEVYTRALDPITGWATRAEIRALENLPAENTPAEITPEQIIAAAERPAPAVNGNGAS